MLMGGIEPPVNENYSQTSCARDSLVVSQVNHVLDTISVNLPNEDSHLSRYNVQLPSR